MKKILVTGGAGFLGSHLCEKLTDQGHDVLCVDNLFTGTKENVAHLLNRKNFELMRFDITFPLYVEVDEIFNLACLFRLALDGSFNHAAHLAMLSRRPSVDSFRGQEYIKATTGRAPQKCVRMIRLCSRSDS
jgi:nucleoside-diphosphate-sugar epimerase